MTVLHSGIVATASATLGERKTSYFSHLYYIDRYKFFNSMMLRPQIHGRVVGEAVSHDGPLTLRATHIAKLTILRRLTL